MKVSTKQEEYEADHVVSTIPAKGTLQLYSHVHTHIHVLVISVSGCVLLPALAGLLTSDHYLLGNLLASSKPVPVAVVNLEYAGHVIPTHLVQVR